MLTEKDLTLLADKGILVEKVTQQIENFKKGFPFAPLTSAASIANGGIIQLSSEEIEQFISVFDKKSQEKTILKFVPASGAASRMFKALFAFAESPSSDDKIIDLLSNYENFAFASDINAFLQSKEIDKSNLSLNHLVEIAEFILTENGLNYGFLPKGLIKFHQYDEGGRTAFEEHLVEGAVYSKDKNGQVHLHFTVSPQHLAKVEELMTKVVPSYEKAFNVKYNISYSTQSSSSDTIAVDMNNEPFREENGEILFRPGGHGALIENLNNIDADIVFIKNIDNVVPDKIKETTYDYKKALGGYLADIQDKAFEALEKLEGEVSEEELTKIEELAQSIGIQLNEGSDKKSILKEKLNRPIRICGMVKNEGEPGGGPFWVAQKDGKSSLQIIESSQIDMENEGQKEIVANATHFNPVDLICGIKDYKGNKFDLIEFIDPNTGFISYKSKNGKDLKAQELPGLWNGAMANWITLFVEVPIITFNPVKTINDLLREQHQS
ncbi:MAG: DUF4301 family protein [Cytophagales bacterium]|nr:DUF4301 family protein [Cytophagales bacterium]